MHSANVLENSEILYFYIFYPLRILKDKKNSALFSVKAFSTSFVSLLN